MARHQIWHLAVLATTLLAGGGGLVLVLAPLLFDEQPPGLARARPVLVGLVIAAALLLIWEWRVIH